MPNDIRPHPNAGRLRADDDPEIEHGIWFDHRPFEATLTIGGVPLSGDAENAS